MARALAIVAIVAVTSVVSFVLGARQATRDLDPISQSPTGTDVDITTAQVVALGKIEPLHGIVNISALPGDEIESTQVSEGDEVDKDQVLVELKSRKLRGLEKELALERLSEAKRRIAVEKLMASSQLAAAELAADDARNQQQELNRKEASLELLRKQAAQAHEALERMQKLADDPVTRELASAVDLDNQALRVEKLELDVEQARQNLEAARAAHPQALKVAEAQLESARTSSESVEEASPLGSLARGLDLATLQWQMTLIRSPRSGRVLRVLSQAGERVGNMPLLQVGDVSQMACVAEVYESNLSQIKPGQTATLTSAALSDNLKGVVLKVGKIIGRPSLPNPNPLSRQDVRTAEVVIELDQASAKIASDYINLQVDVSIDVSPKEAVEGQ